MTVTFLALKINALSFLRKKNIFLKPTMYSMSKMKLLMLHSHCFAQYYIFNISLIILFISIEHCVVCAREHIYPL